MSGLPPPRVAAFILEPQGQGFAALARRAGLKDGVLPAFRAALAAVKIHGGESGDELKLKLVQKVIDALRAPRRSGARQGSGSHVALRRRGGEGGSREFRARGGARSASGGRLPPILDFSPVNDEGRAPKLIADFSRAGRPRRRSSSRAADEPREDQAPRVELPPELVARLDNAA